MKNKVFVGFRIDPDLLLKIERLVSENKDKYENLSHFLRVSAVKELKSRTGADLPKNERYK